MTPEEYWLAEAVAEALRCTPIPTAYCVGSIIVAADGTELARGYSRETDVSCHAEEVALARAGADPRLAEATLYASLEPCGVRRSRPVPCARLIVASPLRRVVYALREPPTLAPGGGAEILRAAGVTVLELPDLAGGVRAANPQLRAYPHPLADLG